MFIETRHYDDGRGEMQLHKDKPDCKTEETKGFDRYVDEVTDLREWIDDNLCVEVESEIEGIILDLENGETVNISMYI